MWKLNKPCINKATGKDIDKLVTHCNALDDADKTALRKLYRDYDRQSGTATKRQLSRIDNVKSNAIYYQYKKTYAGKTLDYIRKELNDGIDLCPNCSINSVSHLDHFMPHSQYKALSVCRLNLVPSCSICNGKKSDDNYNKYVHPYYDDFPITPFLIADITVSGSRLVINFRLDSGVIADLSLNNKIIHQSTKIELWDRLLKESNNFINDMLGGCYAIDMNQLNTWIKDRLAWYENRYGSNDWRTAIIRGIINCNQLSLTIVENYKTSPHRINNGAGA